jgi:GR25 family glycosyltransferase involved in LPS biosynthesis
MLQKALESNVRNILIMEDDAELYHDWQSIWQSAVGNGQLKDDWDMLYLGYNLDPLSCIAPIFITPNILQLNDALTTHAYAVNGKYLESLIQSVKASIGSGIPIDVVYARQLSNIKAYGIYPMLFRQSSGMSDILGCKCSFDLRPNIDRVLGR